jgi:hypothetical protein
MSELLNELADLSDSRRPFRFAGKVKLKAHEPSYALCRRVQDQLYAVTRYRWTYVAHTCPCCCS